MDLHAKRRVAPAIEMEGWWTCTFLSSLSGETFL